MSFAQDITSSAPAHRSRDQWPLRWGVTSSAPYTRARGASTERAGRTPRPVGPLCARGASHMAFFQLPPRQQREQAARGGELLVSSPDATAQRARGVLPQANVSTVPYSRHSHCFGIFASAADGLSGSPRALSGRWFPRLASGGQRYRPHIAQRRNQYLLQRPTNRIGQHLAHVLGAQDAGRASGTSRMSGSCRGAM